MRFAPCEAACIGPAGRTARELPVASRDQRGYFSPRSARERPTDLFNHAGCFSGDSIETETA